MIPEPAEHLPRTGRLRVVRECFAAYETGERAALDRHLADGLVFSAPPDVGIDRATYFERCWANAPRIASFAFVRLAEVGDEVLVTYEATRTAGGRFRNTEIFGFEGDRVATIEVYFGWDLD